MADMNDAYVFPVFHENVEKDEDFYYVSIRNRV